MTINILLVLVWSWLFVVGIMIIWRKSKPKKTIQDKNEPQCRGEQ